MAEDSRSYLLAGWQLRSKTLPWSLRNNWILWTKTIHSKINSSYVIHIVPTGNDHPIYRLFCKIAVTLVHWPASSSSGMNCSERCHHKHRQSKTCWWAKLGTYTHIQSVPFSDTLCGCSNSHGRHHWWLDISGDRGSVEVTRHPHPLAVSSLVVLHWRNAGVRRDYD